MKKTIQLFTILCFVLFWGQGSFEYQKTWGTYYGAVTGIFPNGKGIFLNGFANEDKLYINAPAQNLYSQDATYNTDYYTQFMTEGEMFDINADYFLTEATFSTDGTLNQVVYKNEAIATTRETLLNIDNQGNKYYYIETTDDNLTATPNAWFSTHPAIQNGGDAKILLVKKNENNEVLWRTFLPINGHLKQNSSTFDEEGNLYLMRETLVQEGIGTTGTFQEDFFQNYNYDENLFVVKLNPQGQLLWGTYIPSSSGTGIAYYDDGVYLTHLGDIVGNATSLATAGTFQQDFARGGIMKLDANTGQRVWGTYYAPITAYSSTANGAFTDIKANETGVYVLGGIYQNDNTNYYGTGNAYQSQNQGGGDIFLAKFNHNGNRVWGTYFGTSTVDDASTSLSLMGNKLFFTGTTFSEENIATSGAFQETMPSGLYKPFFVAFNTDGQLQWCSYIGETIGNYYNVTTIIKAVNNNTFYLFGKSFYASNIVSSDAVQPNIIPAGDGNAAMFVMRFDSSRLATSEVDLVEDLALYDNPNDGRFSIKGTILAQGKYNVKLYDTAGRLVFQKNLTPKDTHSFDLKNQLLKGNYLLKLTKDQETIKTFKLLVSKD